MSIFRDILHVKTIAEYTSDMEVSEDACRLILMEAEMRLRQVIKEAVKFMKHYRRDRLTDADVNSALENLKLEERMIGMRQNYVNHYTLGDDNMFHLDNKTMSITDEIGNAETEHFLNKYPLGITVDWLAVNGKVLNSYWNRGMVQDGRVVGKMIGGIAGDSKAARLDLMSNAMIKEMQPNILSKETDKFLTSFFRILQENIEQNHSKHNHHFKRFIQVLHVMQSNPSLQILLPFIINKIERNFDVQEESGYDKKNLYLMVIDALLNNKWINLEYHVSLPELIIRNTSSSRYSCTSSPRQVS